MRFRPRALVIIGFGIGPVLLAAGCGGSGGTADGPGDVLVDIQSTSYVTKEPETSTTTTTIVVADLVAGETSPLEQIYIVQPNDGPSKIASLYDITQERLFSYNAAAWPEGTAHVFFVGDEVKIPPGAKIPGTATDTGTETGTEAATPADGTSVPGVGCEHTVVANDNPTRVAKKYGVTVDELAAANSSNSAYLSFQLGSKINIPANGTC